MLEIRRIGMYVRYLTPDGGRRLLMSSVVIFAIVTMLSRS